MTSATGEAPNATVPTESSPQPTASATPNSPQPPVPAGDEQREDRWIALMFLLFGMLFMLILLWEPIRSLFR